MLSVFTREWLDADVAVKDGHVVAVGTGGPLGGCEREIDCSNRFIIPGLIDAHVHIESSSLTPDQFARAVVPHGTTTVVADPHEIANVLGTAGIRWLLDATEALPLDVFLMAPSCVPASPFESPRGRITAEDIAHLLEHPRVIGLAEMMNYPGVVAGDANELAKIAAAGAARVDGHAPSLRGPALNAYVAAGIQSDHESTTFEEALEKRRLGMWVMLREASTARNLIDLLPLVREHGPERCVLCTDDRDPGFLEVFGHVDQMLRAAVAAGISPEEAVVMATHNAATYHGLQRHGAIAPGFQADLVVLDDLVKFEPWLVLKRGAEPVFNELETPDWVRRTVHVGDVDAGSFRVTAGKGPIRVIGVVPGQLLTTAECAEPSVRDSAWVADADRDLVKIAVVERHHATGRVATGFATHVGLKRGAYASTVAHDAHNVVVMGVDDGEMALCVRRLAELGGGLVVAADGQVRGELALPIAGLMSDRPLAYVASRVAALEAELERMGVTGEAPFMSLSFLALSVIPKLKITDRGLVDVDRFELVPLSLA